jgi:hypothetical protein
MAPEPGFEHSQLKGITIKNMLVTIACTATIVSSGMGAYFGLQKSIDRATYKQDEQNKIFDLRLKTVEDHQKLIDIQLQDLQQVKRK